MAPPVPGVATKIASVAAGTQSSAKEFKKESTTARLLGAGSAGIAELMVFHPVDTTAKRLMSNQGKITSLTHLNSVIFKDKAAASVPGRFFSLFPGLGYAAGYKVHMIASILGATAKGLRSFNVCTSTAVSPSFGTTSQRTTEAASTAHSARAMERR